MLKRALLIGVALSAAIRVYSTLINWGLYNNDHYNQLPGSCHIVKGFENGSEDLLQLPDGTVITSHGIGYPGMGDVDDYLGIVGEFSVFDLNKPKDGARKLTILKTKGVDFDVDNMKPHGIGHFNDGKNDYIFVVNHALGVDTVEKFLYNAAERTLKHLKTYRHELFYGLNDVAPIGQDSFYTTNLMYFAHSLSFLKYFEMFFAIPLSNTVLYDAGNARVVANAALMNGVNFSPDKKHLYIAQSSPSTGFGIYKRLPNNDLQFVKHQHVGGNVDNIEVLANGDLLLGTQISGMKAIMKIMDRKNAVCPSQVLYVKMQNAEKPSSISSLLVDDGKRVNGASVATLKGKHLLVGTFMEKMMYCDIDIPY